MVLVVPGDMMMRSTKWFVHGDVFGYTPGSEEQMVMIVMSSNIAS